MIRVLLVVCALGVAGAAWAEPYLAVRNGLKCAGCHVNPSGGGMRNAYGNIYAQTQLPARAARFDGDPWTGILNSVVALGGDARADWRRDEVPGSASVSDADLREIRLYLQLTAVPDRLTVHIDQHVAPNDADNRELYARYRSRSGEWFVKAGRMYLPYGLRLEDDLAYIRQVPGINFATPDHAVELGWEKARWTSQFSIADDGDQLGVRTAHVRPTWRAGVSVNRRETPLGNRLMLGVFGGLRTGPVVWLAEIDRIDDKSFVVDAVPIVTLLEANWEPRRGHNLKFGLETYDADTNAANQQRLSLLWEYTPVRFFQIRVGHRRYDGDAAIGFLNRRLLFTELHGFF
ncbi:MAG: hypothetical protein WD081_03970 [Gammaproteobacteria bacterium]